VPISGVRQFDKKINNAALATLGSFFLKVSRIEAMTTIATDSTMQSRGSQWAMSKAHAERVRARAERKRAR